MTETIRVHTLVVLATMGFNSWDHVPVPSVLQGVTKPAWPAQSGDGEQGTRSAERQKSGQGFLVFRLFFWPRDDVVAIAIEIHLG